MAADAKMTVLDQGVFEVFTPAPSNVVKPNARFNKMPCGPVCDQFSMLMRLGPKNIDSIQARMKAVRNPSRYSVVEDVTMPGSRIITMESNTTVVKTVIPDISVLNPRTKGIQNFFALYTEIINERGTPPPVPVGTPKNEIDFDSYSFSFPTDLLLERQLYSSRQKALQGARTATSMLRLITFELHVKRTARRRLKPEDTCLLNGSLFRDLEVSSNNKICTVFLSPHVDWEMLFSRFSIRPHYWYCLPIGAKNMLGQLLMLAAWPQRMKQIAEKGYFDLKLPAIINAMGLPDENNCDRPTQYIYTPIEKAVQDINDYNDNAFASVFSISADGTPVGEGYHVATSRNSRGGMTGVRFYCGGDMRNGYANMAAASREKTDARKRRGKATRKVEGGVAPDRLSLGVESHEG